MKFCARIKLRNLGGIIMNNQKSKLSPRFWLALTIFSLMGQVAWVVENMYFNVFIYKMFNASASDISLMVAASAIAATLTTVFIGALSDYIGKRKLFICGGYILWGISIFSFVFLRLDIINSLFPMAVSAMSVGVSLVIILDCVMTFFGSTANDAAFNAWLTDITNSSNRGAAEGINAMMPLVAILVVFGGFMFFDLSKSDSWTMIFSIIGALVFFIGVLGIFLIKEPSIKPTNQGYFKNIFYGFLPSTIKGNLTLYLTLLAFIIFNISIQIFMPYLIIYYEISLGMKDYVLIMAPAIILASVVTALWGKVYDKKGFGFSSFIALLGLILGYVVLYITRTVAPVFIGSLLMMSGYLAGMAVFGAMIRDNTPVGKSGMFQGVRIFSQVLIPGIIGPYIGKLVLSNAETITNQDGTVSFVPNSNIFLAALIFAILLIPFLSVIKNRKKPKTVDLITPFEKEMDKSIPWSEYPRPNLKRDSYLCLNGKWNLKIQNKKGIKFDGEILVPFPVESRLSGVRKTLNKNDVLIYERSFSFPENFVKDKVLLHFGAVDQETEVFVNNKKVGTNIGGYLPFSFDITDYITTGENTIKVKVIDNLNRDLAYGKQTEKRGGMWYTKTSGIWQTVWLESVPKGYIKDIKITPNLDSVNIKINSEIEEKEISIKTENGIISKVFSGNEIDIKIEKPINWAPENPYLYELSIKCGEDEIQSYFALRTVGIKEINGKSFITLNDKPYYFHGLLDQGYFSDGIYLPATVEGYINDIIKMKNCGFNMLRKHIKIEPSLFYYYCDKLGMIVFQDFVNSGKYSFFLDTALPTVFLKKGISHRASKFRKQQFIKDNKALISLLYNHPSVVYYTIFNEGWGQFEADENYKIFKDFAPQYIFDTTSGWFKTNLSDVESEHVYFKKINLKLKQGKPMVLSEFGGYSCKIKDHSFNLDKTYGYKFFEKEEEFRKSLILLYKDEIKEQIKNGLCATVLTQVSDVEDETNGLLTYDRQILKVDQKEMMLLAEELKEQFYKEKV